MSIPTSLLSAISTAGGGQVALIVGAGCSLEAPTSLPLAGACSEEAHRQLVENNVLSEGECAEPWDLSSLADLVKSKNDGKQVELVKCLPHRRFRTAKANEGHLIAAALLLEGAITNIVTLNYDRALSDALNVIGVEDEVSIINGPAQHAQLGRSNVIYLHRSVDNDFEEWILTTEDLEEAWKDAWEETIVRHVIAVPVTVFAGMGSSCGVLRHSTSKIREAVGSNNSLILADPGDPDRSRFAKELNIDSESYVRLGWIEFMRALGERFHKEIVAKLASICREIAVRERFVERDSNDIDGLSQRVQQMGLLEFGAFRGSVLLDCRQFPRIETGHLYSIAGLLLAVSCVERTGGAVAAFEKTGHISFRSPGRPSVNVLLVDGSTKNLRWLTLENQISEHENVTLLRSGKKAKRVLAIGVSGTRTEDATAPQSIVRDIDDEDIVEGDTFFQFWDVEQVRNDPGSVERLLA